MAARRLPPFEPIRDTAEAFRFAMKKRDEGALFAVNHSGGKDSQAMLTMLRGVIPPDQLLVVHADLGRLEDTSSWEHVQKLSGGLKSIVCRAEKDLLQMVRRRRAGLLQPSVKHPHGRPDVSPWPDSSYRQCTSDLKRGPSTKATKKYADSHGFHIIVDALGLRAQESPNRAKLAKLRTRDREHGVKSNQTGQVRQWYVWHPIHDLTETEVWKIVKSSGHSPHPVYATGKTRAGCKLCILGSKRDLQIGALHDPELYRDFVKLEQEVGHTVHYQSGKKIGLEEWTGIPVAVAMRARNSPAELARLISQYVRPERQEPVPKGRRLPLVGDEPEVRAVDIIRGAGSVKPKPPPEPRRPRQQVTADDIIHGHGLGDAVAAAVRKALKGLR
jgi:3'-phosphoadenosine 5'-phosphosulfate sulfotransferase (PAPS reductase)/FAD synthetase